MPCRSWKILGASKKVESPVKVGRGADLSGKKKIIFWTGRGKTGKTTGIRWAAETAVANKRSLLMADMDPTNDTFSKYVANVSRPPEASDPAIALKWLDKLLQHALQQRTSLLVDLGGGDTTLRRLVTQLPDLVAMFEAQGFAVVVLYAVGPQEEDLSPLATLEGLGFRPTATAIVLNEAMIEVGDTRLRPPSPASLAIVPFVRPSIVVRSLSGCPAFWPHSRSRFVACTSATPLTDRSVKGSLAAGTVRPVAGPQLAAGDGHQLRRHQDVASVREGAQAPDLPRTSDELGREIERMQAELDRATQLGGLRNDPTLPLIRALSASLGLQWRLHDQAVGYFHSASSRLDRQLADTIAQGEQALETRRVAIVEKLAPMLADLTTKNVRTWSRAVTLKTALSLRWVCGRAGARGGGGGVWRRLGSRAYLGPQRLRRTGRRCPSSRAGS